MHFDHSLAEQKAKLGTINAAFPSHNNLNTNREMEVTVGSDRFTEQRLFSTQSVLRFYFCCLWQLQLSQVVQIRSVQSNIEIEREMFQLHEGFLEASINLLIENHNI